MCCRVKNFLGCISLEGYGLFSGYVGLILSIIAMCFAVLNIVIGLGSGNMIHVTIYVVLGALFFALLYFDKEFIEGIKEKNHQRMTGRYVINIIELSLSILMLPLLVVLEIISEKEKIPFEVFIRQLVSLVIEIYTFICINSLYLRIKEERNKPKLPDDNNSSNQQQQPLKTEQFPDQQPPSNNSPVKEVVIEMHAMHPENSRFLREFDIFCESLKSDKII